MFSHEITALCFYICIRHFKMNFMKLTYKELTHVEINLITFFALKSVNLL